MFLLRDLYMSLLWFTKNVKIVEWFYSGLILLGAWHMFLIVWIQITHILNQSGLVIAENSSPCKCLLVTSRNLQWNKSSRITLSSYGSLIDLYLSCLLFSLDNRWELIDSNFWSRILYLKVVPTTSWINFQLY